MLWSVDTALWPAEAAQWKEITLGSGCYLSANTKYAIVARAPSGDLHNEILSPANMSGAYPRGAREWSGNSGSSWTTLSQDVMFEEWGIPS